MYRMSEANKKFPRRVVRCLDFLVRIPADACHGDGKQGLPHRLILFQR